VVANAAGSRYYVLAKSSTNTLVVADEALSVLQQFDLGLAATSMALSPDGKRLYVLTSQLRVYDASGSSLVDITPASGPDVGVNPVDVAFSHDSTRAFILSSASRKLTVLNVNTLAIIGSVSVPGLSTAVAVSPSGFVYASAQNRIYQIDGDAAALKAEIALNGQPGRLVFTPDGKHALAVNETPLTGKAIWYFNLETVTEENYFSNFGDTVKKIAVVSNSLAYGFSSLSGRLFVITLSPFNMDEASFSNLLGDGTFSGVTSITASDELPASKYLYVATSGVSLTRVNLATSLAQGQVSPSNVAKEAAFVGPAATGTPASAQKFNDNQQVDPGATTRPLIVRALNSAGRPMANVPVTFSTTAPGATLQNALAVTNANGFAQATVKAPSASGNVTVDVDLGGGALTATFTVIVGEGGGPGGPGGLSILSGNGLVVRENYSTINQEPLVIKLLDDQGAPRKDVVVTFAVKTGSGTLNLAVGYKSGGGAVSGSQITVKTNADGTAAVNFTGPSLFGGGSSYSPSTITAKVANTNQVSFIITTIISVLPGGGQAPDPLVTMLAPPSTNRRINGKVGQTIPGAIRLSVVVTAGFQAGQAIPGVGVKISTGLDPAAGPTAECAGGLVLTDATGVATCDVVIGPKIGTATLRAYVGGFNIQPAITLTVTPGDAGAIEILSGNNQVGTPGQRLPVPLTARITDAGGNPLPGVPAQWEVVTPGTATLSSTTSVADSSAQVSTTVTLGNIAGPLQIRVRAGNAVAMFTLSVSIPLSAVQMVSGDGQTTLVNTAFPLPLVVKAVDAQGVPVAGIPVAFVILSGSATLSVTSGTTDAVGQASTAVTAGASAGQIKVQAGSGDFGVTFTLNSVPPGPVVALSGVRNSISGDAGVTPGGIIAIYGTGLALGINGSVIGWNVVGPLPTTLADVEVMFGSLVAPIYSVNNINGQQWVVVQAPFELAAPGTVNLTIKVGGGTTTVNNVPVKMYQPGIFETLGPSGERYALILKEDGSYVSPASPADRSSKLRVFVAGVGQTTPASGTNHAGVPGQTVNANLIVGVNDAGVKVISAETMVGAVGVVIVQFEVPAASATGATRPFAIAIFPADGSPAVFGNPSTIAIQ